MQTIHQPSAARRTSIVKLGPNDHGRPWVYSNSDRIEYKPGFAYEIIEGRLYVSPQPNPPGKFLESWVWGKLYSYSRQRPGVINWVCGNTRVFVSEKPLLTVPEPDVAAYKDFPLEKDIEAVRWQDVSPILVVEILTGDPEKDLVRNVDLYLRVPTIREYWVVDGRASQSQPTLRVYRRHGKRWVIREHPFESIYTTRLLPGFELRVDPRA